ncbi:MAG: RDD family protein [Candidatus Eremiobacteraeota bacterium]|nr:RDD family protein [Candidatus Eremiobacteraeota bacterium]
MDRSVDVRTPESIALRYELAGLGSRFLALVIDQAVQLVLIALIVVGLLSTGLGVTVAGARTAAAIELALTVFLIFAIFFGYFVYFETAWNGQTPGKRALGIRVVRDGGYPLDFGAALVRNIVRLGEIGLGYYAISAVSMLLSKENKRLGDFAAGTIVVREGELSYAPRSSGAQAQPDYAPTLYLSGSERAVIKRFLERRDTLEAQKRSELARRLANRVRDRVPSELQRLDDESLLERL